MNPNHPNNYPPFNNQFKPPQPPNYPFSPQHQSPQNSFNTPKPNFQPQNITTDPNQLNRNKLDRAMYSSTIEGTLPSKSFGIGKLQSMGRFIGGNDDFRNDSNKPFFEFHSPQNHFPNQKPFEQPSQVNKPNDFDRFPSFNLNENHSNQPNYNSQQFTQQSSQGEHQQSNSGETLTPEEKRRREILAIKQELEMINKKMESTNLNKKGSNEPNQNEFRPTGNTNVQSNGNNSQNNYLNTNNNSSGMSTGSSYGSQNYEQGIPFTRSNNKGLVTQSMIVTNEPSTGFKFQSLFDKYDSMKKPTYETTQVKDDKPSLLDQFVKKGPGSDFNKDKKPQPYTFSSNGLNSPNSQSGNKNTFDFNSITKNTSPVVSNNFGSNSNFGVGQNSNSTSQPINSAMSLGPTNVEPPKEGGMFKKKKFTEDIKTDFTPANFLKSTEVENNLNFKKSPKNQPYEENIVTNAMKQMKIEESVDFKREDFIVGKKLGKGQFGEVMLVQHKKTGFLCGMKVMEKKQIRDEKYEGQIARELSVQFYLAHRNIAPLYGYFQDEKNVYLLVEYCTGGQLLEMLRKNRRMQEPEVSRIIRQIIEGIDYIHKELIIHRDIKPQNILFNFGVAKICDFGWAVYKGHGMRKTASVGSPLYYSPEIVMGVEYDQKIDIWDIGMMTYECLLGKIPFRIYSQLDLNRIVEDEIKFPEYIDTSEEAKDFILRIMKKKPEERMEIREMLRHPFITKYQDQKLPIQIMKDFKEVLG